jgi:hypothetical protein
MTKAEHVVGPFMQAIFKKHLVTGLILGAVGSFGLIGWHQGVLLRRKNDYIEQAKQVHIKYLS